MTRVLVPVAVLDGETVSPGLMTLLANLDVTVLGYHVLPEQTPPDQARVQYEERATDALEDLSEEFRSAGGAADHRLVFTHDKEQTIRRIANEIGASALAISGMTGDVDRILVSLTGETPIDRIVPFVEELIGDREIGVTLFRAISEDGAATDRLDAAAEQLTNAGVDVRTSVGAEGSPFEALVEAVAGHDAVVMSERAPSFSSLVFGEESDRVAAASVGPVLVVRDTDTEAT